MSTTTFTTALSTPGVVNNNNNTHLIRKKRTRLFFSQLYYYFSVTCRFIYTLILPTKLLTHTSTTFKNIPTTTNNNNNNNNNNTTTTPVTPAPATQYYKNKTLILDLDETLVHSVRLGSESSFNTVSPSVISKKIEVQCDKQSLLYQVYKRPHVDFFLKTISQWYRVVIYTASMAEYADPVIDWLDQDNNLISQRFFRQSCVIRNGNFLKDLTLAEKDLNKVCLVDNSPIAFDLYKENGIALPTWISNPNDESLLDLLPFLDALRFAADVRSILKLQLKSSLKK